MNKAWPFCFSVIVLLVGATLALAQTPAPALFFSDLSSGPATGGENGNGAYVTLYGRGFGTTQGASTVSLNGSTSSLRVVSWGAAWLSYQKIVVQLLPSASTGNLVVTVNGVPSNGLAFTVRSGRIFFVSTSGSDSNNGSFASPWRTLMKGRGMAAGDITYAMNGVSQTSDDGSGTKAALGFWGGNNAQRGTASAPIALVAYPGATVTVGSNSGPDYGLRVIGQSYWIIAGLTVRGNVALQMNGNDHSWAIGNDASCGNPVVLLQGCMTATQSDYSYFYGNYIHDVKNPSGDKQEHTLYFTTDTNHAWAGWNTLANNDTCYAIQFHSSPVGSGTGFNQFDLHVHDNIIHGDACAGINFATIDPSQGPVEAYNNVIYHTGVGGTDGSTGACIFAPGYTNTGSAGSGTVDIYNNTFSDCGPSGSVKGAVVVGGGNLTYRLRNNIFYSASSSEPYLNGSSGQFICSNSKNDFFGNGGVPSQCGAGNLNVNPGLVSVSTGDFHLQAGSPMIAAGLSVSGLSTDLDGLLRPVGLAYSIGAYEFTSASGVTRPNPPTNLQVTVQ